jgi:GxxExxY protein
VGKTYRPIPDEVNKLSKHVTDAAFKIHHELGPGLLEGAYESCMVHELAKRGLRVERQVVLPVIYDGVKIDAGFRMDLLIEKSLIVELKSVETLLPIHEAQLLTYLKLSGLRLGLLVNFNVRLMVKGLKRIAL